MKKPLMLFIAILFACGSLVARAMDGPTIRSTMSSENDAQEQGGPGSPGNDDQNEHGNENALSRGNHDDERAFLVFGSMIGVDGSFLGADIRGVMGDALPHSVRMARGLLSADGKLRINVRGLVLTSDTAVPAVQRGTNDQATFHGLVSCLSEKSGGGTMTVNVMTDPFTASTSGNAEINGSVALPAQCLAPIVFVTNAAGDKWLAVIGTETSSSP